MLLLLWEYRVRPERTEEFEALYRPDGPWGDLFRNAPGFVSVTLLKDFNDKTRFLVADRWTSESAYESFRRSHGAEYADLSARGRRLYERETEVGRFDFLE